MKLARGKLAVGLLIIAICMNSLLATLYIVRREKNSRIEGYTHLSELNADFIRDCQNLSKIFSLNWELTAAVFQIRNQEGIQKNYPSYPVLRAKLLSVSQGTNKIDTSEWLDSFGMDDKQRVKIVTRTKALKRVSNIVSNKYSFPYRKNCYYQNTWGADREGGKRKHEGTDLFTKEGTPIYAISSGKLEKLGWNRLGGERVGIRGEDGIYFYYAHLSKINPKLVVGSYIEKETLIGYTGHTGDAVGTPDHLHFGMEVETGVWINPYYFLKYWQMESDGK